MLNVRNGLVVVGCVFVGFVTSAGPGLVARAAEPPRWVERALAPSNRLLMAPAGEARNNIAQLEQRVKELEAERRPATWKGATSGNAPRELEAVMAQNRELEARNRALAAENQALVHSHLFQPRASATACEPPPGAADPRAQIRYWAQRLRDGDAGFRGRLTADQNAAIQVLLKPERELDPLNPWRELGVQALASAK